jgi:hypothetical protein
MPGAAIAAIAVQTVEEVAGQSLANGKRLLQKSSVERRM